MKRVLLAIPLLAIVLALPFAWAAPTHIFEHPASLPAQAAERAQDALDDRGTHGGGNGNDQRSDNAAAEVKNISEVDLGNSVVVKHSVSNGVVNLNFTITVTPGQDVDRQWVLRSVDAPGNAKVLPVGPPSDVPQGPPADVPVGPPSD